MRQKRYSVEQFVAAVKQQEMGTPVVEIVRKLGIAEQTFYRWKKLVADLIPEKAMLADIAQKSGRGTRLSARQCGI